MFRFPGAGRLQVLSSMLEWLALLLPVAAASGWFAAQRQFRAEYLQRRTRALHESYTRGVGLLIQDRIDEALEALSPFMQSDIEGLELRLAVGQLFRKKGQVEKALAVHESLASQSSLSKEQAEFVSYQLGMDYLAAGLLDRAEVAFKNLLTSDRYRPESLCQLLKIYQRESDWWRAIDCTQELRRMKRLPNRETVAQFYCELAAKADAFGNADEAMRLLQRALNDDPHCVRATIEIGRLLMHAGKWGEALTMFVNVERQDPIFISEILERVATCCERLRREKDLSDYLRRAYFLHGCEDAACALVEQLDRTAGASAAKRFLLEALSREPSLKLSRKLLKLLQQSTVGAESSALQLVLQSIPEPWVDSMKYRCYRCGFQAMELHWNCPSCHGWETIKPKQ